MDTSTLNVTVTMYILAVYIKSKIYKVKAGGLDSVGDWENILIFASLVWIIPGQIRVSVISSPI